MTQNPQLPASPADFLDTSPAARFAAHYQMLWEQGGQAMSEINPALAVEAIGFTRFHGDWLGVVVTPWFLRLFLVPGGGSLWGDIPLGQRRYLAMPSETMTFIADLDPALGPFQYSTLIESLEPVSDMAAARQMAQRVMQEFAERAPEPPPEEMPVPPAPDAGVSRRDFFRRLVGKR